MSSRWGFDYWPNDHFGEIKWVQVSTVKVGEGIIVDRDDGWIVTDYVWNMTPNRVGSFLPFYMKVVII